MKKGNSKHLQIDLGLELTLGKIIWDTWPQQTREMIIQLLQHGQTPKQIENSITPVLKKNQPNLHAWKINEQAGRFYLAAQYALKHTLRQS